MRHQPATKAAKRRAAMIGAVSERTVPEEADRADVSARYEALLALRGSQPSGPVTRVPVLPAGNRDP
jgi:hypothetical protein